VRDAEWFDDDHTRIVMDVEQLEQRNRRDGNLATAIQDLCWKATPCTTDDTDAITSYLVPAGVLHRLAGHAQGLTDNVTIVFRAEGPRDESGEAQ